MTEQTINNQTKADLNFQDRLDEHSKKALIFLVDQLTSVNRNKRGWVLKYLRGVEALMRDTGITNLQNSILDAIANERLAQDCQRGPIKMRPRTLEGWTDLLARTTSDAHVAALYGQKIKAMKGVLTVATEAVAALEDRIDAEAEAGKEVLASAMKELTDMGTTPARQPAATPFVKGDLETPDGPENKTADPVGAEPAAKSESLNNQ